LHQSVGSHHKMLSSASYDVNTLPQHVSNLHFKCLLCRNISSIGWIVISRRLGNKDRFSTFDYVKFPLCLSKFHWQNIIAYPSSDIHFTYRIIWSCQKKKNVNIFYYEMQPTRKVGVNFADVCISPAWEQRHTGRRKTSWRLIKKEIVNKLAFLVYGRADYWNVNM